MLRSRIPLVLAAAVVLAALLPSAPAGAAQWSPAVVVSPPEQFVIEDQLAVNPAGDAVVVWWSHVGPEAFIEGATRPAGGAWSAPSVLAQNEPLGQPRVAIDAAGDATVVWQNTVVTDQIKAANYIAQTGTWGNVVTLSEAGRQSVEPAVAVDPQGHAIAVWSGANSPGVGVIRASVEQTPGGPWSAPVALSGEVLSGESPAVAFSALGNAVAAWGQRNGTTVALQVSERGLGGSWSAPVTLSPVGGSAPQVAMNAHGDEAVVWERRGGGINNVQATLHPIGGAWTPVRTLSDMGSVDNEPQVALTEASEAVAVWDHLEGAHSTAQSAHASLSDGEWSGPAAISAEGAIGFAPSVSVDPLGNAIATWQHTVAGTGTIQSATRPTGGGAWSTPIDLSTPSLEPKESHVGFDAHGRAVAIWKRWTGTSSVVESAALETPEAPVSPPQSSPPADPGTPPAASTKAPAGPACRAGYIRRKVKVRVRVKGAKPKAKARFKTKTVLRCVKRGHGAKPKKKHPPKRRRRH